jgi:hypothetical protein
MFKVSEDYSIISDEGFSVDIAGMWAVKIKYLQGGKSFIIGGEHLAQGPFTLNIFGSDIKRWDSGEIIDENKREIIIDNIVRAMTWRDEKVHIDRLPNQEFTKPTPDVIASNAGYSIEKLELGGIKYSQNGKTLIIESEKVNGSPRMIIKAWSIVKWDSGELIDQNTKGAIIDNIAKALAQERIELTVELRKPV